MRITSLAAAIAMLTIAPLNMAQAAETFDTLQRVQAVPMTDQELGGTTGAATAIEYGLIQALVSVAAIGALTATSEDLNTIYDEQLTAMFEERTWAPDPVFGLDSDLIDACGFCP